MQVRALALVLFSVAAAAQESRAVYDAPLVVIDDPDHPPFVAVLDFDGDGRKDALGFYSAYGPQYGAYEVRGYRQTAAGRFVTSWWINVYDEAVAPPNPRVEVFVVPGVLGAPDGRDDFAFVFGKVARLYNGTGTSPALEVELMLPGIALGAAIADFDGDGTGDLAVALEDELLVWLHRGTSGLELRRTALLARSWTHLLTGEFDGSPGADVALVDANEVSFHSLAGHAPTPGRANPALAGLPAYRHGYEAPNPAVGDIDGDGDDDVVLFGPTDYRVVRQRAPGRLVLERRAAGGPATGLADIDGDGDLDGVCCGGGGGGGQHFPYIPYTNFVSRFELSPNRGDGSFEPAFSIPSLGAKKLAGAADMDGDGDVDLVAGRVVYFSPGAILRPTLPTPGQARPRASAIADLDGDGDPDFEIGIDGYRRNTGDGETVESFLLLPAPPAGATFLGPGFPGDFTGDGLIDLLVEAWDGGALSSLGLHLLRNAGGEVFVDEGVAATLPGGAAFSQATPISADCALVADYDMDGRLDLGVRSARGSFPVNSWVWLNDGAGGFQQAESWPGEWLLAVEDFTGDGRNDVLVYQGSGGPYQGWRLRVARPEGGFLDPTYLNAFSSMSNVSAVQLWNDEFAVVDDAYDGVRDIVTVLRGYRWPHELDGRVGGFWQYTPWVSIAVEDTGFYSSSIRYGVIAPDAEGDGTADLVACTTLDTKETSAVLLRDAAGVLANESSRQVMLATSFADVDGDGDEDLLGDRLIRSRRIEGPAGGSRKQFGDGSPGAGGVVPTLGARGPFRTGETVEFLLSGGVGGQVLEFHVSRGAGPTAGYPQPSMTASFDPGHPSHTVFQVTLQGPALPGQGRATIPFVVPSAYSGETEYYQAFVQDPEATDGWSASNGLVITFGE